MAEALIGVGQRGCLEHLASITHHLRSLATTRAPHPHTDDFYSALPAPHPDDFYSALPAPHHLPLYHSLHPSLKALKQLSPQQLRHIFSSLHLAIPMFAPLPLRTLALRSRFIAADPASLDLSNSLRYSPHPSPPPLSHAHDLHAQLHSPCFLFAYAPAFHALYPPPTYLDMSNNALTDENADVLANVLAPFSRSLCVLDLSGNPGLCVIALEYLLAILPLVVDFSASVPPAETAPEALAPLLATASADRRAPMQALSLHFPPRLPHSASSEHSPPRRGDQAGEAASVHATTPSSPPQPPHVAVPAGLRSPHRFQRLQRLHLLNVPAAFEDALLAAFPVGQLRVLDLSIESDAEGSHACEAVLLPAPQPLHPSTVRLLSASPSPFSKLHSLNLHGRCMPAAHACAALDTSTARPPAAHSSTGPLWMSPTFRNLPKLKRLDVGSLPFVYTGHDVLTGALQRASTDQLEEAAINHDAPPIGKDAREDSAERELCAVGATVTGALLAVPHALAQLTSLTALNLRGITCSHRMPGMHALSSSGDAIAAADAWGRALRHLTDLQQLTLVHACMCCDCAHHSAESTADALSAALPPLESLELSWNPWDRSTSFAACMSTATAPPEAGQAADSVPSGVGGPSSNADALCAFQRLAASLAGMTSLSSLTLRVPVHLPWRALQPLSGLRGLQQLVLEADRQAGPPGAARSLMHGAHACSPGQIGAEGVAGGQGGEWQAAAALDVTATMHGLRSLTALTKLHLCGVGALKGVGDSDMEDVGRADAVAGMLAGSQTALVGMLCQAAACEGRHGGACPVCASEVGGARAEHACPAGMQELVLAAAPGVRAEVAEVCAVLADMQRLQRLEVAAGGDGLSQAERRQVWDSAKRAPLLRGVRLR
eukprot:jgi/Ulvmu1/2321/UM013_0169.1